MRFLLMILIAALSLVAGMTAASGNPVDATTAIIESGDLDEDFDDGGYDGSWNTVETLDVEIFLPDGWTGEDVDEDGVCYRARSEDGATSLAILYPVETAPAGEVVSAGGKEARLLWGEDGSLTITMALSEDRLAGFRFERASENALSEDMALQIAGSCTDVW